MSNSAQDRTQRQQTTREKETRKQSWAPPSLLPVPEPRDGWVHRWVRTSIVGQSDNRNVSMRLREGWEPVKAEDYPEFHYLAEHGSEWAKKGAIEVGGLLLCRAPQEMVDSRREYYEKMANQQMEAIDNNLMKESDSRMPILAPERSTRVRFGNSG